MRTCNSLLSNLAAEAWRSRSRTRGGRVMSSNLGAVEDPSCKKDHCTLPRLKCSPIDGVSATRGFLATDHVILNHGQVTWTTLELAPPLLTTTPHQREDVSALDRFSVHHCPARRVFSGTGLELVTRQATIRYLYHSATMARWCFYDYPKNLKTPFYHFIYSSRTYLSYPMLLVLLHFFTLRSHLKFSDSAFSPLEGRCQISDPEMMLRIQGLIPRSERVGGSWI
ncbi:uncharacterized protein TNCV_3914141 [Trichonephila clavipes]|nr:uncharacterized protein TNCV_3914141 [Trichonephila clavipes]